MGRIVRRVRLQISAEREAQHSTLDLTQTRGDFLAPPGKDIFAQSQEACWPSPHTGEIGVMEPVALACKT